MPYEDDLLLDLEKRHCYFLPYLIISFWMNLVKWDVKQQWFKQFNLRKNTEIKPDKNLKNHYIRYKKLKRFYTLWVVIWNESTFLQAHKFTHCQ